MGCFADCLKCLSAGIIALIILGATLGFSITSIVLGAINLNSNCTGISQIPAYFITSGVLGLITVLLRTSERDSDVETNDDGKKKKDSLFMGLIELGQFGVVIWGSVIVFGADRPDCDTLLYDYAFWSLIAMYIILVMCILFICLGMSSACCQAGINNCCGDGECELTYECNCCGRKCGVDGQKNKENKKSDVVIDMPHIGSISSGTEC